MITATLHTGQTVADATLCVLGDPADAVAAALLSGIDPAGQPVEEGTEIVLPRQLPTPACLRTAQRLATQPPATALTEGIGGWAVGQATVA